MIGLLFTLGILVLIIAAAALGTAVLDRRNKKKGPVCLFLKDL